MRTKAGWILTVMVGGMLLFSAAGKLMPPSEEMRQGIEHLGISMELISKLGILELVVAALFLIPQTAFFGTILVTGYMGGAIFAHVRVGDLFVPQVVLPVLAWVGYALRHYDAILPLIGFKKTY